MPATPITVTEAERAGLASLVRRHTTAQQIVMRARIVLAAAEGATNVQIVQQVGLSRESVRLWRDRWAALRDIPLAELSVAQRLTDAPRPGTPARITAEQVCQIVALACAAPATAVMNDNYPLPVARIRPAASCSHHPAPTMTLEGGRHEDRRGGPHHDSRTCQRKDPGTGRRTGGDERAHGPDV